MSALWTDFHFLRPLWLLGVLALPLILKLAGNMRGAADAWRSAVDEHLLAYLIERDSKTASTLPKPLIVAAWLVACVALAGPAWERVPQPLFANRAARVLLLELAPSMLSADVRPSRLERARYKISDLLKRSGDGQVALIGYAGDAFTVAPLTDDANTVANLVDPLDPTVMPVPGNNTPRAIDAGVKLIQQAGLKSGDLLLFADSLSDGAEAAAQRALQAGVRTSVLAIGTAQGAPVTLPQGGFLKDSAGNLLLPKTQFAPLQALAAAGGGRYATLSADGADLDALLGGPLEPIQAAAAATQATSVRYLDRGPWLLFALLPLVALGFRRGWLLVLPLALSLPPSAHAVSWNDLWQRADQQAQARLDAGDAKTAQTLARDPALRASAAYKAADFPAAAQDYSALDNADGKYNLGNALAKQGRYPEAIAAYDEALARKPDMEDAAANKKAVEDFLKQQKQQQDQRKNDKSTKDQQDKKDQQKQQGDKSDSKEDNKDNSDDNKKDGEQDSKPQDQRKSDEQQDKDQQAQSDSADKDSKQQPAPQQQKSEEAQKKSQEQFAKSMDQALKQDDKKDPKDAKAIKPQEEMPQTEQQQALQQWLERVPDDPGGLLRRKFQLEYQRRQAGGQREERQ
jgi:Ca-activated chloride channel homolog